NYFGNRAPVHIGHHFSLWNGGAYWNAMQAFAKNVCGLPEVQCVTYKDLQAFMDKNAANRAAYMAGNFTKLPRPPSAGDPEPVASSPQAGETPDEMAANGYVADTADAEEQDAQCSSGNDGDPCTGDIDCCGGLTCSQTSGTCAAP